MAQANPSLTKIRPEHHIIKLVTTYFPTMSKSVNVSITYAELSETRLDVDCRGTVSLKSTGNIAKPSWLVCMVQIQRPWRLLQDVLIPHTRS